MYGICSFADGSSASVFVFLYWWKHLTEFCKLMIILQTVKTVVMVLILWRLNQISFTCLDFKLCLQGYECSLVNLWKDMISVMLKFGIFLWCHRSIISVSFHCSDDITNSPRGRITQWPSGGNICEIWRSWADIPSHTTFLHPIIEGCIWMCSLMPSEPGK